MINKISAIYFLWNFASENVWIKWLNPRLDHVNASQSLLINVSQQVSLYSQAVHLRPCKWLNEQAFEKCVVLGWKGEASLLGIVVLSRLAEFKIRWGRFVDKWPNILQRDGQSLVVAVLWYRRMGQQLLKHVLENGTNNSLWSFGDNEVFKIQ